MIKLDENGDIVKVEQNKVTREAIVAKREALVAEVQPYLNMLAEVDADLAEYDRLATPTVKEPAAPTVVPVTEVPAAEGDFS